MCMRLCCGCVLLQVLQVWDPRADEKLMRLKGHIDNVRALLLSPDGTTVSCVYLVHSSLYRLIGRRVNAQCVPLVFRYSVRYNSWPSLSASRIMAFQYTYSETDTPSSFTFSIEQTVNSRSLSTIVVTLYAHIHLSIYTLCYSSTFCVCVCVCVCVCGRVDDGTACIN